MHASEPGPELDALMLPLQTGAVALPAGPVLFLNARAAAALSTLPSDRLQAVQGFRPFAGELERAGWNTTAEASGHHALVLLLVPRQREQARALMARALTHLAPGGCILAAAPNSSGARSAQSDLQALCGPLSGLSKHKCRVFWTGPLHGPADADLAAAWAAGDAPRPILGGRFHSRPGLFAWDRVDPASALLARHLPEDLSGAAADLGAGWGFLADALLSCAPGIGRIDLFEAQYEALALARANLQPHAGRVRIGVHWHDVTAGLPDRYDVIVSNPPFHQGRADDPALGRAFIASAAAALQPRGQLFLVANRHLPYEAELQARFGRVRVLEQADGFKAFRASEPRR